MKSITIAGRLTRDAEIRTTQGGDSFASFSVAVDDRSGKEKGTIFFDATLWGARGEKLAEYLTKGSSVCVTGDLGTREHNGKTYLTVRVNDVTLQGGGDKSRGGGASTDDRMGEGSVAGRGHQPPAREQFPMDDDIPF